MLRGTRRDRGSHHRDPPTADRIAGGHASKLLENLDFHIECARSDMFQSQPIYPPGSGFQRGAVARRNAAVRPPPPRSPALPRQRFSLLPDKPAGPGGSGRCPMAFQDDVAFTVRPPPWQAPAAGRCISRQMRPQAVSDRRGRAMKSGWVARDGERRSIIRAAVRSAR